MLTLALLLAPVPPRPATHDLEVEPHGPCTVWTARTPAGEHFLKNLPARFRSPIVEVVDGVEVVVGRVQYHPLTRSLSTCPALQTEIKREAGRLRVKEEK